MKHTLKPEDLIELYNEAQEKLNDHIEVANTLNEIDKNSYTVYNQNHQGYYELSQRIETLRTTVLPLIEIPLNHFVKLDYINRDEVIAQLNPNFSKILN